MRLLVVEDEAGIRDLLVRGLGEDGHEVVGVASAEEARELYPDRSFGGYLVDIALPGQSGIEFCRWLRHRGVKDPIMFLTARSALADKLEGLDSGADDYLTKPFEISELAARWRAIERKVQGYPRGVVTVGDLEFDPDERWVRRGGEAVELSKKEFSLLEYLVVNRGAVVSRAQIAKAVWGAETSPYTNVIDVFMAYLRKKIDGDRPVKLIHTVRGRGFILATEPPTGVR